MVLAALRGRCYTRATSLADSPSSPRRRMLRPAHRVVALYAGAALALCACAPRAHTPNTGLPAADRPAAPVATTGSTAGADARPGTVAPAASGTAVQAPSQVPGGCSTPARERPAEIGCYLTAVESLGIAPPHPLFWHLDAFPSRAAAESARRERGTVVESLGRVWLFTMAQADWRPVGGERVARVGPFPMTPGRPYTARYMEAVLPPGIRSIVHRHSGGEGWYVAAGGQCLETPDSTIVVRAGQTAFVPEGPPMMLVGIGAEVRRTVLVVVHDEAQPWMVGATDWVPKGTCPR